MNITRKDVETAIFSTTDYSEGELADMDLDELEVVAEVLCHTDTDLDAEEIHAAISDLTN